MFRALSKNGSHPIQPVLMRPKDWFVNILIIREYNILFKYFSWSHSHLFYCFKRKTLDGSSTGMAFFFLSIFLLSRLRTTKQIQADGTFKTVPNFFYQIFTLHFKAYKKVTILTLSLLRLLDCFVFFSFQVFFINSFPVAFLLMSEKSLPLWLFTTLWWRKFSILFRK
jgi:hypothetical protein